MRPTPGHPHQESTDDRPHRNPTPRYLEDSAPGDLLRVRLVAFEFVPCSCWELKIQVGDVLLYLEKRSEGVLVARPDGRQVLVPQDCTRFVGVQALAVTPRAGTNGHATLEC